MKFSENQVDCIESVLIVNHKILARIETLPELPPHAKWAELSTLFSSTTLEELENHEVQFLNWVSIPYPKNTFYAYTYKPLADKETALSQETSMHHFEPTPFLMAKEIFDAHPIPDGAVFLDLGGGIGKMNLLAALYQPKLKSNICIELNDVLVECGLSFFTNQEFISPIEFINDDILSENSNHTIARANYTYHYQVFTNDRGTLSMISRWIEFAPPQAVLIMIVPGRLFGHLKNRPEISTEVFTPQYHRPFEYQQIFVVRKR